MSNLKDNDMDGLFQRASERYPLRTDSADWDRMAAALDQDPSVLLGGEEDRGHRRRWAWLLLLLPLAGIGYWTINWAAHKKTAPAVYAGNSAVPSNSADNAAPGREGSAADGSGKSVSGGVSGDAKEAGNTVSGGQGSATGNSINAAPGREGSTIDGSGKAVAGGLGSATGSASGAASGTNAVTAGRNDVTAASNNAASGRGRHRSKRTGNGRPGKDRYADAKTTAGANIYGKTNDADSELPADRDAINSTSASGKNSAGDNMSSPSQRSWIDPRRAEFQKGYGVTAAALVIKKDSSEKKKASAAKKNSFIYAGVIGAPDYSTIHLQSSKGVGTTFGLLIGYAFNQRWAIETGAYIETKKYYTKGEYFNTKSLNLSGNESINNLNGTCTMWEIPINVRYNFNPEGHFRWFATAGISTYLMTSEKYTALYQESYYGNTVTWPKDVQWKGGDNYLFSIFNFSGGFEQKIGKVGNLRIEPYWRIPLSGLGHGNLSILSTGLNIGFTRRLW